MTPIFSFPIDVRWREMDALGHVNNAQYLSYVEEARVQWFRAMQADWQEAAQAAPIVAAIHMDFRKPAVWPEPLAVHLLATQRGGKSATIGHRIVSRHHPETVYAEGYTVMVWVDASGRAGPLPAYIAALFENTPKPNAG